MKLIVIGSSSKGNSYALQAESGEILLLEAGVPLKEVKKAIGYKTEKVVGVLVSHIHVDHCKYIKDYIKACLGVYSNIRCISCVIITTVTPRSLSLRKNSMISV